MYQCSNLIPVTIELPLIEAGIIIGEFDLVSKEIFPNVSNSISFKCGSSVQCCTDLKIPISEKDILKIEKLGYALDQIVSRQSPFIKVSEDGKLGVAKYYWIKRKPFTNSCRFLNDENRCEIYEFRPFGCRIFPFSINHLTKDRVRIKIHPTNVCKSVKFSEYPENEKLLIELLESYSKEISENIEYFDKFRDEI